METILGHEDILKKLLNLLEENRLPHALLLVGPEGIGKQKVARILSQKLLGTSGNPDEHPDFHLVEADNGRIKIDTIREIKKLLNYSPLRGNSRVVLINDAHSMNAAAANSLLKSLEEPPKGTYFILITHASGWIPKTIVSRTQKIRFSPLSTEQIKGILKTEGISLSPALIPWAQGSPLAALTLAQVQDSVPSIRSLIPSREAIGYDGAYALAQATAEENQTLPFLQALLSATHQILTGPRKNNRYDFDLLNFADRILEIRNLLRQNINPKIHLTRLLLYFQEPIESRL